MTEPRPIVTTVKERCRVCYTCVRECPAKAIRISDGQAEVIPARCIGCGNCVMVCSQQAKVVVGGGIDDVEALLGSGHPVAACLAPSFPAEFNDIDPRTLIGMLRKTGFTFVNEVAFGADLVAERYRRMLGSPAHTRAIATTCPAIVEYIQRYHCGLVDSLAPIVSPMIATARALRRLHGPALGVVFIGPCIAKKIEVLASAVQGEVQAAITFAGLRKIFERAGVSPVAAAPSDFDPPRAGLGMLFPISSGMLQAAGIQEDLVVSDVVASYGRSAFVEAIRAFEAGDCEARLLEVLCCNGCIMGPGIGGGLSLYERRARVSRYVRGNLAGFERARWQAELDHFADLDLSRDFQPNDQKMVEPSPADLEEILKRLGKLQTADELNCGACGYDTCREHAVAIFKGLAESEMCLPYTIDQLKKSIHEQVLAHQQLASMQEALMQSEKLASMGQLAAGIAHEVNNPLGVVLLYAHLLQDELGGDPRWGEDLSMIVEQADRCKKIVAGLLHFARQNKLALRPTRINRLLASSVQALRIEENLKVVFELDPGDTTAEIDRDQINQVLANLIGNARDAMGGRGTLTIRSKAAPDEVSFSIGDTGHGITRENLPKIFEPFFTTKQIGKGTGLGLAVTYGIIKMHRGDISVESNADPGAGPTGSTFTVRLKRKAALE